MTARTNTLPTSRRWLLALGLLVPLAGCANPGEPCAFDKCPNLPPGAMPQASGSYLRRIQDVQSTKAEADDFVVYKHEWYLGGTQLGPYGRYHLQQVAQRLPNVPFHVTVQGTPDGKLNEQRRQEIVKSLLAAGVNDAEQRVVVGYPEAEGLYGDEAALAFTQMMQGGSGFGGFIGNGFGNGLGTGFGNGLGGGNFFFGGGRSPFRGGLGVGTFPFF